MSLLSFACYLTPPNYVYTLLSEHNLLQNVNKYDTAIRKTSNPSHIRTLPENTGFLLLQKFVYLLKIAHLFIYQVLLTIPKPYVSQVIEYYDTIGFSDALLNSC